MKILIDPNARLEGGVTFSGFEDIVEGDPGELSVGLIVEAYVWETSLHWQAKVTQIDVLNELVYLLIDWSDHMWEKSFDHPAMHSVNKSQGHMMTRVQNLSDEMINSGNEDLVYCGQRLREMILPMSNQEVVNKFMRQLESIPEFKDAK